MAAGVIKELTSENRSFYNAKDVQELLQVSQDKAYKMIRAMQKELVERGELTKVYPQGRIPKKYFNRMCGIE